MSKRAFTIAIVATAIVAVLAAVYLLYRPQTERLIKFRMWINRPALYPDWSLAAGSKCGAASFLFPTDGFVGFLWGDSFRINHTHQGIDIFGGAEAGVTRVISAYPGYLTRLPEWKSAVIVRVPNDPLHPGQQIWLYYTHMADRFGNSFIVEEFPAGTSERPVEAGALLGYQGDYSGDPNNPVGVHLHFSIVKSDDAGKFESELNIKNTLDPSPYLGLPLNAGENRNRIPLCESMEDE
ncbi:MAG: hypothetical protein OZ914_04370 [Anaerolineaceae bacterium]|jgi:hypothetical protein|nr:hypothetical protein [Anaerolineaceae bacterium]OQY89395.1 MAG: hypothetical protein B6D38_07050 [Anaerolineae bacterium UTCFX1]